MWTESGLLAWDRLIRGNALPSLALLYLLFALARVAREDLNCTKKGLDWPRVDLWLLFTGNDKVMLCVCVARARGGVS